MTIVWRGAKAAGVVLVTLALTQAALAVPAKKPAAGKGDVTRAQLLAEVKQVFTLADTNHDGFMGRDEFRIRMGAVLNRTPPGTPGAPSKAEAQRMLDAADAAFSAVDTNGDGKLSLGETSQRPLAAFDAMDTNHDRILTLAEKKAAHTRPPGAAPVKNRPAGGR